MLVSSNVTMQFGSKPLFENISVNSWWRQTVTALIGANGSGKIHLYEDSRRRP